MSKVIKNFDASTHADASRVFEPAEVGDDAKAITASAEERAAHIISEAEREARTLREDARTRGLDEGKAGLTARLEKQIAEEIRKSHSGDVSDLVETLTTMIREVNDRRGRLMRDSKEHLISLALNIARSVIKREVRSSDDVARLNLEEAIRLSAKRSKILIHVSMTDMKTLEGLLEDQPLLLAEDSTVEFVPSADIIPGGCLVESASGSVDARIDTQLREIEKVLIGEEHDD